MNFKFSYSVLFTLIIVLCTSLTLIFDQKTESISNEIQIYEGITHANNVTYYYCVNYDIPSEIEVGSLVTSNSEDQSSKNEI